MSSQKRNVIISANDDGELDFLYDDRLRGLFQLGPTTITRKSHIEPGDPTKGQDPLLWYAEILPAGPTLGGFTSREEALDAEHTWLTQNSPPTVPAQSAPSAVMAPQAG